MPWGAGPYALLGGFARRRVAFRIRGKSGRPDRLARVSSALAWSARSLRPGRWHIRVTWVGATMSMTPGRACPRPGGEGGAGVGAGFSQFGSR